MKQKIKGIIVTSIFMAIISAVIFMDMGTTEKFQYINNLDYNVTLNKDGSMNVIETWDINVNHTNTLFKNFDLSSKFGEIKDVSVVDLKTGKQLKQIDIEMYHVTKDCYYALPVKNNYQFEIAWGTGLDNSFENKKYQISYKVENVINEYKDVQEWYWQFLAKGKNDIPVNKVTGIIELPQEVIDIDNLYVWGHGQINGKINKINKNKVSFKMKQLNPKSMLEIRVITKDFLFQVESGKIKPYNYLQVALREENKWANEANQKNKEMKNILKVGGIVYLIIIVINVIKIIKYKRIEKQENTIKFNKLEYFREIPREETATPAEAAYLYNYDKKKIKTGKVQSQIVASTILDLALKKAIELKVEDKEVYIKLTGNKIDLKQDELTIYNLLKDVMGKDKQCNIRELKSYAKRKYEKYSRVINKVVNQTRKSLYKLKLIDKSQEKLYNGEQYRNTYKFLVKNGYRFFAVFYLMSLIPICRTTIIRTMGMGNFATIVELILIFLPIAIILMYKWDLQEKINNKIAVLTKERKQRTRRMEGIS